ncbi:MAG TPA: N-acetylmuramoyl-L-alanine amidase [Gemmatimonadales bacterium]
MAPPLSATKLLSALRAEGLQILEHGTWKTHNRNHKGPFDQLHGVMLHHTGDYTSEAQMVQLCYDGRSDLPGPLCHGVIDKRGRIHLVGYGRANHAGPGDPDVLAAVIAERPLPADNEATVDGNRHFWGFEAINRGDGKDPWPEVQVEAMVRAPAAILRAYGWGKKGDTSTIGHLEWQPGKPDPRGPGFPGMNALRERVAQRLRHPASWSPGGTGNGTYTVKSGDTLTSIARAHRTTWQKLWTLNRTTVPDPDHLTPGQVLKLP